MFKIIKELKMGKSLYQYELHRTDGLPYAVYFSDISSYVGERIPLHWHREFEISYITEGKVKFFVDDAEMVLEKGEGLFVNSGMFHGCRKLEKENGQFITAVFDASFIFGGEKENIYFTKYLKPVIDNKNIRFIKLSPEINWQWECLRYMKKLSDIENTETPYYEFLIRDYLTREICIIDENNKQKEEVQPRGADSEISVMTDFIKANYAEDISVLDIANSANVSRRECFRRFHESMAVTPFDYLDSVRIKAAMALLAESEKTVTEICYETGFSSGSYFSLKFKKAIGCSPLEYRKNTKKQRS